LFKLDNIKKGLSRFFKKKPDTAPIHALCERMPQFLSMARAMEKALRTNDPLFGLLLFFKATSPVHDAGFAELIASFNAANLDGCYDAVLADLHLLWKHVKNAGRAEFGMNRTKAGEEVTIYNVYVGDLERYGILTLTLAEWQLAEEPGRTVAGTVAGNFMQGHVQPVKEIVERLRLQTLESMEEN